MAGKARGYYRDTRTGAIRQSSAKLGYPYTEADESEIEKLPTSAKPAATSRSSSSGSKPTEKPGS